MKVYQSYLIVSDPIFTGIAGGQFKLGVVLYDGSETLPLGDRLWAMPISTLWGGLA